MYTFSTNVVGITVVTVMVIPSTTISVSVGISVVAVIITMVDPGACIADETIGLLDVKLGRLMVEVGSIY